MTAYIVVDCFHIAEITAFEVAVSMCVVRSCLFD